MGSALGSVVHCACARLAPTAIEPPNSSDAAVKDRNANDFNIDYLLGTRRRFSCVVAAVVLAFRHALIGNYSLHQARLYSPETCTPHARRGTVPATAGQRRYGQPGTNTMHLAHDAASLDTTRPRWDDAAQGGAADGAPRESSEPPPVRCRRGWCWAGGRVWAAAVAGGAGSEGSSSR